MIHDTNTCDCELCRWANRKERDQRERKTVPCGLCGQPTVMTGTKRCDRCWELEMRIRMDTDLAKQVIANLDSKFPTDGDWLTNAPPEKRLSS